jgi:hypothetical protein
MLDLNGLLFPRLHTLQLTGAHMGDYETPEEEM